MNYDLLETFAGPDQAKIFVSKQLHLNWLYLDVGNPELLVLNDSFGAFLC